MENRRIVEVPLPGDKELLVDGQHDHDTLCNMLKDVKGFEVFERPDLEFLSKHMQANRVRAGSTIYFEGDRNSYLSILIDGSASVYKQDSDDNIKYLASLSPGRIFGEISVIDNLPYSASIVAESDATIVTISRENFRQCVAANPIIGVHLLDLIARLLCARLRSVSNQLVDYIDV